MVTIQISNYCTTTEVYKKFGFTYYTVSCWLDHNLVKWIPAGSEKLVNMKDLDLFLNEEKGADANE